MLQPSQQAYTMPLIKLGWGGFTARRLWIVAQKVNKAHWLLWAHWSLHITVVKWESTSFVVSTTSLTSQPTLPSQLLFTASKFSGHMTMLPGQHQSILHCIRKVPDFGTLHWPRGILFLFDEGTLGWCIITYAADIGALKILHSPPRFPSLYHYN